MNQEIEKSCYNCGNNDECNTLCKKCVYGSMWKPIEKEIEKSCLNCAYNDETCSMCNDCEDMNLWEEKECSNCKYANYPDDQSPCLEDGAKECIPGNLQLWETKEEGKKSKTRPAATPEPMSTGNGNIVITEVIRDLLARDEVGQIKYKTSLKTDNGRDALMDAFQEACDLVMYLKQAIMERDEERIKK